MDKNAQHECTLDNDEILSKILDTGIFLALRKKFRKCFMVSKKHPYTCIYFKSERQKRIEKIRHLVKYYYMIHPFSSFSLLWSSIMAMVFWVYYVTIPFHIGLPLSKHGDTRWILLVCHLFNLVHVALCFFTGFYDSEKSYVEFDKGIIARRYLFTHFLPEILSISPIILTDVTLYSANPSWVFQYLPFTLFLKIFRVTTWFQYLDLMKLYYGYSDSTLTMFKMCNGFIEIILWTFSLIYHTNVIWGNNNNRREASYMDFLIHWESVTELLLNVQVVSTKNIYVSIIALLFGFIFQLLLYVWVSHVWEKTHSVRNRHGSFYQSLEAYMTFKALPVTNRKRIKEYCHFKYQKSFYKEASLRFLMSEKLKLEVMSTIALSSITKVNLFINLPVEILVKFSKYLNSEIYLPGDLIIHAGTKGEAMFFILAGTVEVISPSGKHICFLQDGAHFGEIALILYINRVASVKAVTACEMLRLSRTFFLHAFRRCSSQLEEVVETANHRIVDLGKLTPIATPTKLSVYSTRQMMQGRPSKMAKSHKRLLELLKIEKDKEKD